jgi:aminodeoxyfutalosine synthase
MNKRLLDPALLPILAKVESGERLTGEEGMALYASRDLNGLGYLASIVRERKNGNVATYVFNRYINYSNICILNCQFCAFSA